MNILFVFYTKVHFVPVQGRHIFTNIQKLLAIEHISFQNITFVYTKKQQYTRNTLNSNTCYCHLHTKICLHLLKIKQIAQITGTTLMRCLVQDTKVQIQQLMSRCPSQGTKPLKKFIIKIENTKQIQIGNKHEVRRTV